MRIIYLIIFIIFLYNHNIYSLDLKVNKTYYGEVNRIDDSTFIIKKDKMHQLGKLKININYDKLVEFNAGLKIYFNINFSINKLNDFEIFSFEEESEGQIYLKSIKSCLNCNGVFYISIPKNQKEIKLVIKNCEYGMYYAIFKLD